MKFTIIGSRLTLPVLSASDCSQVSLSAFLATVDCVFFGDVTLDALEGLQEDDTGDAGNILSLTFNVCAVQSGDNDESDIPHALAGRPIVDPHDGPANPHALIGRAFGDRF